LLSDKVESSKRSTLSYSCVFTLLRYYSKDFTDLIKGLAMIPKSTTVVTPPEAAAEVPKV